MLRGRLKMKMKRKDLEDVNLEFSDISLSSPARKIRRLDTGLLPIIEEDEHEIPMLVEQFPGNQELELPVMEDLPSMALNDERAIVRFEHVHRPFIRTPSNYSISVHSDIISELKSKLLVSIQSNNHILTDKDTTRHEMNKGKENFAVVPWVPFQPYPTPGMELSQPGDTEFMESEEMGEASMDIEENYGSTDQRLEIDSSITRENEGLNHWQQQHCNMSQLPQNPSTPISW